MSEIKSDNLKPIIGINIDLESGPPKAARIQSFYYESILRAGGVPVLLPPMPQDELNIILHSIHGVLLIGGNDYCPSIYGEDKHASVELVHEDRLKFDLLLAKTISNMKDFPFLGICGGLQLINLAFGGSLYQDIPTEFPESKVGHASENGWKNGFKTHLVNISQTSKLFKLYKRVSISVPTSHHQAVKTPGAGLNVSAHAEDGVIEAIELRDHNFAYGVQWHPERDYEGNKMLFESFIQAAQSYGTK